MRTAGLGALTLVAALLVAGCVGAETGSPTSTSASDAANGSPVSSADEGGIEGSVTNDERAPVPRATVGVVEASLDAQTGEDGRFAFAKLPPGTYSIVASALGYETAARRVTVLPGEVTKVDLVLVPVAISEARAVHYIGDGYQDAYVTIPWSSYYINLTGLDRKSFIYNLDTDVAGYVTGLQWSASLGTNAKWAGLFASVCAGSCLTSNYTAGLSPLVVREDDLAEMDLPEKSRLSLWWEPRSCFWGGPNDVQHCSSHPDTIVQLSFQQRVKLYTSVFYVDPPPPDHMPFPK